MIELGNGGINGDGDDNGYTYVKYGMFVKDE